MPYANAKAVVRSWLAGQFPTARVVTRIPANLENVCPLIVVGRIGGSVRDYVLDDAQIDVTCFAKGDASTIETAVDDFAEQVRAALLWLLPGASAAGGTVLSVAESSAPKQVPYDNTNLRRSEASYRITIRSVPTEGVPA